MASQPLEGVCACGSGFAPPCDDLAGVLAAPADARAGISADAATALYDRLLPRVRGAVRRVAGLQRSDWPDAEQEAFIRILRGLPGWRGDAQLCHWAVVVATRAAIDFRRRAGRKRASSELDPSEVPAPSPPPPGGMSRPCKECIEREVATFSPKQQEAWSLHYAADNPVDQGQIARQLGVSRVTVNKWLGLMRLQISAACQAVCLSGDR
jgi:RNA polymerase sigma factor (sigma-70 family)